MNNKLNPLKTKRRLREPFSSASHLSGAFVGVFGAAYLLYCCDQSYVAIVTILIYSLALIMLFLVSGLLHGLHCSELAISRLERLDYAAIYFFIAGTYTPICLFVIAGRLGLGLLIVEWALAFLGAWLALTRGPKEGKIQVLIYLVMGWAFVLALPSLSRTLVPEQFGLLILGAIFYSIGAVIFFFDWPSLWRNRYTAHDFWHLLVLLGSAAHYLVIMRVMGL